MSVFYDALFEDTDQRYICESKAVFLDEPSAQRALTRIRHRAESGKVVSGWPTSYYRCRFGAHWHLTSHNKRGKNRKKVMA
jgi:hypothetical protein